MTVGRLPVYTPPLIAEAPRAGHGRLGPCSLDDGWASLRQAETHLSRLRTAVWGKQTVRSDSMYGAARQQHGAHPAILGLPPRAAEPGYRSNNGADPVGSEGHSWNAGAWCQCTAATIRSTPTHGQATLALRWRTGLLSLSWTPISAVAAELSVGFTRQ